MCHAGGIDDHPRPPADVHTRVAARLAAVDQRYTRGRRRLVDLLATAGRPLTLPEITEIDPDLAQSSIYRNLDVLERTELVRRLAVGPDHARFELAEPLLDHHHHLVCVDCGAIEDVRLDDDLEHSLDAELAAVAESAGFVASHHSLDLHGWCTRCSPEREAPPDDAAPDQP